MDTNGTTPNICAPEVWARFRFAVVSRLLAMPPPHGGLQRDLAALADQHWQHPLTGSGLTLARGTIERWYYRAKAAASDPLRALKKHRRRDAGTASAITSAVANFLRSQHANFPTWSYQLHYDNLAAAIRSDESLGARPSYATVRRYMQKTGLYRDRRRKDPGAPGHERREVRSFEVEHTNGLWHLDFHHGSRRVLTDAGEWEKPIAAAILDDHSRVVVHFQWYLRETTEALVHALSQAILRFGLPRALLSDNGGPMTSEEMRSGLARLGVAQSTTLPYSPYQNGKQETWFGFVEGRLMPMLGGEEKLSLKMLNDLSAAWVSDDYNRRIHREIGVAPLDRFLASPGVGRPSPSMDVLRAAFRRDIKRKVRRSDGTVSIDGVRFEIPHCLSTLRAVVIRYATWEFRNVHLVDERTGDTTHQIWPLDKAQNSDGRRRMVEAPLASDTATPARKVGLPPLAQELLQNQQASGVPPAYLPKDDAQSSLPWRLDNESDEGVPS